MPEGKVVQDVLKEEPVTTAMSKLKRERLEVSINPKKFLLDYTNAELEKIAKVDRTKFSEEENKQLDIMEKTLKDGLEQYSDVQLEGVMVPLRYKELQAIKDGVLEAVKYGQEFNWDEDIRLRAMIREEHTLTVYLSLKKKNDLTTRYYSSLEEIALETETTINALYALYQENFVLSEVERKN